MKDAHQVPEGVAVTTSRLVHERFNGQRFRVERTVTEGFIGERRKAMKNRREQRAVNTKRLRDAHAVYLKPGDSQ